jgi:hypothetical protein
MKWCDCWLPPRQVDDHAYGRDDVPAKTNPSVQPHLLPLPCIEKQVDQYRFRKVDHYPHYGHEPILSSAHNLDGAVDMSACGCPLGTTIVLYRQLSCIADEKSLRRSILGQMQRSVPGGKTVHKAESKNKRWQQTYCFCAVDDEFGLSVD